MAHDFRRYHGRVLLVQLDEHTVTGILSRHSRHALTLTDAALLADTGTVTPMDGDVVIERIRVQWVQVAR